MGAERLLAFVRALIARPGRQRPVDLVHVSAGAHAVRPGDHPSPVHALAGALLKSLAEECGWLRTRHLDLSPGDGTDPLPLLTAEAAAGADGADVAYRDGLRYERRLAPLPDSPPRAEPPAHDGFTLLTGGLGGVGTEIAAHLLRPRAPGCSSSGAPRRTRPTPCRGCVNAGRFATPAPTSPTRPASAPRPRPPPRRGACP